MDRLRTAIVACLLGACAPAAEPVRLEDWMRVGVDARVEAELVERTLVEGGFVRTSRIALAEDAIAMAFERADGRRAVRVVTSRGVAAALDSHEPDGVRVRHGPVRIVPLDDPDHDLDRDGRPELVVAQSDEEGACLAVLRVEEDGRVVLAPTDAEALIEGGCVIALEDVDGDGPREALVALRWPELRWPEDDPTAPVPSLLAPLTAHEGGFRARGVPVVYAERERAERLRGLEDARRRLDFAAVHALAVELAALAHLEGAAMAAQVRRYDDALGGFVLDPARLAHVRATRAYIGRGWRARDSRDTSDDPSPEPASPDHDHGDQEEEDPGGAARLP